MEIKKIIDELTMEIWTFHNIEKILYLSSYVLMKRESTRHRKYKNLFSYNRLSGCGSNMSEEDVPFTDEIRNEALELYRSQIKCLKWSERDVNS